MNIYIDESGSINNHSLNNKYFVISMIHVLNKNDLKRAYKRFVQKNYTRLMELDQNKIDTETNKVLKSGGKMFSNKKFRELKGVQFDRDMKQKFVRFFSERHLFDIYYIKLLNNQLTDDFCSNTARAFNYSIRLALSFFIKNNYLPNEDCLLQLDERNEKTEARFFLENYLNTELKLSGVATGDFRGSYFDSADNKFIQIADVFANLYFSQLQARQYTKEFEDLRAKGILKFEFEFPK